MRCEILVTARISCNVVMIASMHRTLTRMENMSMLEAFFACLVAMITNDLTMPAVQHL